MTDEKLIIELVKEMGKRLDDVKKEIEGVKTSYQFGSKTSKEFFDKVCEMQKDKHDEQQKQIDNHCKRIRGMEKRQATTTTKLTVIISGIIFAIVFAFDRLANWLDHLLTNLK